MKFKTQKELKKLNTKNLLRYYKAERQRFYGAGFICGCCGDYIWEINERDIKEKERHDKWKLYLESIKAELNTREHISN